MYLSDLDKVVLTDRVLIVQAHELVQLFISDRIKEDLGVSKEQFFDVKNKNDLKTTYSLGTVQPFDAIKWFITVYADNLSITDLLSHIDHGESCFYLIVVEKYFNYKKLKTELVKHNDILKKKKLPLVSFSDLYLAFLRYNDFLYLYSNYLGDIPNKLTENLREYVFKNYAGDIEALFLLLDAMKDGEEFEKEKDIVAKCGLGKNTTQNFLIKIMTSNPKTEKGLKTALKNNFQRGMDLSEDLSWEQIWSFTRAFIKSAIEIKSLCISGVVYKDLHNVPESYDIKRLSRYNRYLWFIRSQPMSKLLAVYMMLDSRRWTSELEFYRFLCEYYKYSITINLGGAKVGTN